MAHKKAGLVVVAIGLIGLTLFLAREPILSKVGDFLVVQDKVDVVDVIHVIAGPDEYTDYAARLFQKGYGKKMFFTLHPFMCYNFNNSRLFRFWE